MNRALCSIDRSINAIQRHDLIFARWSFIRWFSLARSLRNRFEEDGRIRILRRTCSLDTEYVLDTVGISQERMSLRKGRSSCLVKHFLYGGKRSVMDSRNGTRTEWIVKIQRDSSLGFLLITWRTWGVRLSSCTRNWFCKEVLLCMYIYVCVYTRRISAYFYRW